jgi:hypothetical protein
MKDITESIFKSLSEGNILLLVIIVIVALIFNFKKIIDFYEERKKVKILNITEALECKHITSKSKAFLEEELATELFYRSTGVGVHEAFRETIIDTYKKTQGKIKFAHYVRATRHFIFDKEPPSISVNITLFEKIGFWVNFIAGMLFAFTCVLFMLFRARRLEAISNSRYWSKRNTLQ